MREVIEAVSAKLLYLPPYSPDLNPIELAWAKFKTGLRKAAERTLDDLWRRIGILIENFSCRRCNRGLRGVAPVGAVGLKVIAGTDAGQARLALRVPISASSKYKLAIGLSSARY